MVLLLGALTAFGPISIDMYLPALPAIARSLHGGDADAQLTLSAFFVGIAAGQLVYGPVADRRGRRGPLLFGLGLYLVGSVGCMLAVSIPMLIGFRVLQALGGCAGVVIARAVVRDRFAADEVLHVFSMLSLVMGVAPILAPLFGGWVLLVGDWRWIFGVQIAFAAAMALGVFFALPESLSPEARRHARGESALHSYWALLKRPRLVGYLLAGAFAGAALFTYVSCSPDVVIGYFHISPQAFGWVFGTNAVGLVVGAQVNARLARRLAFDRILRLANAGVLLSSIALLVDALTRLGGFLGVAAPLFLIIGGMGFNQANTVAGALNVDPRRAGATAALLGSGSFAAGAGASALAGALRDGTPRPMAAVILASMLIAFISLTTLVRPARKRPSAA
ncbi:MAG: multidrug effflux MFS transporter [Caulobacteraceae bacterium]|nr:multidrug effflux MFS transporter [Caulobacteraceae bacterium]